MTGSGEYRELAEAAWTWTRAQVRDDGGPWLPVLRDAESDAEPEPSSDRDSLYDGVAGLAPMLAEIRLSRELTDEEQNLATRVADRLRTSSTDRTEACLYFGLAGDAAALRMLAAGSEQSVVRRLGELVTPDGWPTEDSGGPGSGSIVTDVVMGTAGTVMTLAWLGQGSGREAAAVACAALLRQADRTPAGLDWGMRPDAAHRMPNYSHGTAGVAAALAVVGAELGRGDLMDAALAGAEHLLSIATLTDSTVRVPHTVPPAAHWDEPFTYTWCHGSSGTSYLFAALQHAGVPAVGGHAVEDLRAASLRAAIEAGVPQRLRPGFWDNDGRCCGTAGVGEALLDGVQAADDPGLAGELLAAARTMGDALVERAVVDAAGARWQFLEHRRTPPLLPPGTTWMQGAPGIAAFLLRLARVLDDGPDAPVVDRPDQWWAVPERLRAVRGR